MRKKILLNFIILIIIGSSITGFFASRLTQNLYKKEIEDRLVNTISLINYQISQELLESHKIDYNKAAKDYSSLLNLTPRSANTSNINIRVTFIDFGGNVLGESDKNYKEMENHLQRKEVQDAIQGKIGRDVRPSQTLSVDYLYIAMPIKSTQVVVRISIPLIQLQKIDGTILFYVLIGIAASLIVTALLAFKFSSSLTEPINELSAVSKQIASGNYSKRTEIKSKGELGQLAAMFNEMSSKLEKTVADLTDKNIKFDSVMNSLTNGIVAIDNRKKIILINEIACNMFGIQNSKGIIGTNLLELIRNHHINSLVDETLKTNDPLSAEISFSFPEERILRINTSLIKSKGPDTSSSGAVISVHDITNIKKLEQIRTDFVSNVTHELKTPLTSIRGFVETLREGAINDSEVAEKFLEIIDIEAERLYMLINDILQLSEIETRQKDYNIKSHNLESIIKEIISILEGIARKKGIAITYECDPDLMIVANKDRIKQMLLNLTDNAIKYNKENGSVLIKAYRAEGKIILSVKDTGIGIASVHINRIFERFYRVDKGRSRSMGGTGLGLSIVKHIVNLYSGDIKINSEPGKGTEFTVQLPV
jgi:two-component system phosphate regulon sensor histidine kinase PhoR